MEIKDARLSCRRQEPLSISISASVLSEKQHHPGGYTIAPCAPGDKLRRPDAPKAGDWIAAVGIGVLGLPPELR